LLVRTGIALHQNSGATPQPGAINKSLLTTKIMKTLVASLFIALSALTYSTSFAQASQSPGSTTLTEKTQTTIVPRQNNIVDVIVRKAEGTNLLIRLVDEKGRTLADKPLSKQDVATRTRFDLSALPDGLYQVVIVEGTTQQVNDIILNTDTSRTITLS
jgi:hypothetical protein